MKNKSLTLLPAIIYLLLLSSCFNQKNIENITPNQFKGTDTQRIQAAIDAITITNINFQSKYRRIAIRANDSASIQDVYINGLITKGWEGHHNSILLGGKGYGKPSLPGSINNIYAINIMGNGRSLVHIEEAIADCYIINGIYHGDGEKVISYNIDEASTKNVITKNIIK